MGEDTKTEHSAGEIAELTTQLKKAAAEVSAALCSVANEWEGEAKRAFLQKAVALGEYMTVNADALAEAGSELYDAVTAEEKTEDGEC